MRRHRRAKIVATVGPASASPDTLKRLFLAGADTFRLNFSHGTHEDHASVHRAIRALEREVDRPIGILQDLQGPKIRVGTIRDGKIVVEAGETIRRSEEHTSELQSLMRISYAVFCLKKKTNTTHITSHKQLLISHIIT